MADALKSTIVFMARMTSRTLIQAELKARGITSVVMSDSVASCLAALKVDPLATLILDTDLDEREMVKIMRAAQGQYRIDTRPIYLLAYLLDEKILAYALEYNVLQLHRGEISKSQIELNVTDLCRYGQRTERERETYDLVIKARRAGELQKAHVLLEDLYRAEPDNVQGANELASALCDLDRWHEAQDLLIEIIARFSFDTRAKHLLARCFMKRADFDKARYYLEQASVLSPFNVERLCELAQVLLDDYQLSQALGTFQDVLKLDPEVDAARLGQSQCELLLGEANDIFTVLRQMQDPFEFASVFNGAAIVAIRAGHFQQGIGLYKTAVGHLVEHPSLMSRVFFNMGLGLHKWGKGKLAIAAFEKAVELDASNSKAKHNATQLVISLKRRSRLERNEGPFSALNSIDTIEDFDELGEENFDASVSRS
ncbi:MAG: tetratricopeptide repeat protein [Chitinophagaceae bacterium]|nr:tetratricopeptide repeat protein [Oligoflexus sp.]